MTVLHACGFALVLLGSFAVTIGAVADGSVLLLIGLAAQYVAIRPLIAELRRDSLPD